jgi:hypothetical protein
MNHSFQGMQLLDAPESMITLFSSDDLDPLDVTKMSGILIIRTSGIT